MLYLDIWILLGNFLYHFSPQARAFQHVSLVYGSEFLAAGLRRFESFVRDTFYFIAGVDHRIVSCVVVVFATAFAEVYVAGEFAEEKNVGAFQDLGLDAGSFQQFVKKFYGAQVGIEA